MLQDVFMNTCMKVRFVYVNEIDSKIITSNITIHNSSIKASTGERKL